MDEYTNETQDKLDALELQDSAAYTQLVYCRAFRLSEEDMATQLSYYEEENGVILQ